jgi:signal transduction histidine kinase
MSKVRPAFSLRLARAIILLAIPLFILSLAVFYKNAQRLLEKEAVERSVTILNATEQLVENYLSAIETAARSNVWMLEQNFTPDSLQAVSRRIVTLNKSVLSCSISTEPNTFPEYGRYFSVYSYIDGDSVVTALEPEFEYFEKNWYKTPMRTGRPCWINPFSDFSEGTINHHDAVGSFCMPIRPDGKHIAGVISADFSFQKLRETVLATHHPYPSSYYMLLGPKGGYLIHPNTNLLFKKTIFMATDSLEHPDIIKLGQEMVAGRSGTMHVNIDGKMCHVCYAPVAETGSSLALICEDDDVMNDYNHLMLALVAITFIGIVLIGMMTRRVVQQNIGPLNQLIEETKKIAAGNYDSIIEPSTHKDVVGRLQNTFRRMQLAVMNQAKAIHETEEEIEKETKELEQMLPKLRETSAQKQKFIQSVSRQIATPLNVINGLTNVMLTSLASADDRHLQRTDLVNVVKTMKHNAVILHRMTLMLYDCSETGTADVDKYKRKDVVSCNMAAREIIEETQETFDFKGIQFKTELPDSACIKTNHLFLMRMFRELLYNAIKYSDGKHISLTVKQTDTAVHFIVEDVGPGLPSDSLENLSNPFVKVNEQTEGLGLGLPLNKIHAQSLGGVLIYDASYQQGCRFIVELPK